MASLVMPFLKNGMHVHKSFSNETIIIQDCWIKNGVVWAWSM